MDYGKMLKIDLIELVEKIGVDTKGLNKTQLVDILEANDANKEVTGVSTNDIETVVDKEHPLRPKAQVKPGVKYPRRVVDKKTGKASEHIIQTGATGFATG